MAENDKKEVFISYCTKNAVVAKQLLGEIEGTGVKCWMAPRDIKSGESWAKAINSGIHEASILALLVSEASMNSEEVKKELDLANTKRMTILPIRIESIELKDDFKYHLSNKQWVEALDDGQDRFKSLVDVVLKNLKKPDANNSEKTDYSSMARLYAAELNNKYLSSQRIENVRFSGRQNGDFVDVGFSYYLGSVGAEFVCRLNSREKIIEIFANRLHWDSRSVILKYLGKNKFDVLFPRFKQEYHTGYKICTFEPAFRVTFENSLWPDEKLFSVFRDNADPFFKKLIPDLLCFYNYSCSIVKAIAALEIKLKNIFPENIWRVGAPEGQRLIDFVRQGKICVYKESWEPKGFVNYNGRGLLSFVLESGSGFLDDMYIGIMKYEPWHDLGKWQEKIIQTANQHLGLSGKQEEIWPWWQGLGERWSNSGIGAASLNWDGNVDDLVDYCVDKFKKLKELEHLIDNACGGLMESQKKNYKELSLENAKGLYIYSRLMAIVDSVKDVMTKHSLTDNYKVFIDQTNLTNIDKTKAIYIQLKVSDFDVVFRFVSENKKMYIDITNIDPPDYETLIINNYMKKYFKFDFERFSLFAENDFDNGTYEHWLDKYEMFVTENLEKILPYLSSLEKHLQRVVDLTDSTCSKIESLYADNPGWVVKNKANSLKANDPISFWHTSWLRKGAKNNDYPPVMFQMIPTQPCFDHLLISLRKNEQFDHESEQQLLKICGACTYAFGEVDNPEESQGVWSARLQNYYNTGGSCFDKKLIDEDEMAQFFSEIVQIKGGIEKIMPMIKKLCDEHNVKKHLLRGVYEYIENLTEKLKELFPEKDGWNIYSDAKELKKYSGIKIYKESWQYPNTFSGSISFAIESQEEKFDNFCYGIIMHNGVEEEQKASIHNFVNSDANFGPGGKNRWWAWWGYADQAARYIGSRKGELVPEPQRMESVDYFVDKFSKLKENLTPVIDDLIEKSLKQKNN